MMFRTMCLIAILFLAAPQARGSEPVLKAADQNKQQADREKAFLLRAAEEQDRILSLLKETMTVLEERTVGLEALEPQGTLRENRDLLEWYQQYVDWLRGVSQEVDADVSACFSRQRARAGWADRYDELARGYSRIAGPLGDKLQKREKEGRALDGKIQRMNRAMIERRVLVTAEDLELVKVLWPFSRDRSSLNREAVYQNLTDDEIELLRRERSGLEELKKQSETLTELERYELEWIAFRTDESAALSSLARAIDGGSSGRIEQACGAVIRQYEADGAALRRKTAEIDRKMSAMTRSGTMRTLERLDERMRYYETMKSRFERHGEWLQGQVGGYQADLVALTKDP